METTTKVLKLLAEKGATLEMFDETSLWICFPPNGGLTFNELDRLRERLLPDLGDSEVWASDDKDGGIIISLELPEITATEDQNLAENLQESKETREKIKGNFNKAMSKSD